MFIVRFSIPSDFQHNELMTVIFELQDWGARIRGRNPLIVEVDEDVEDIMGLGMDYGLSVVKVDKEED